MTGSFRFDRRFKLMSLCDTNSIYPETQGNVFPPKIGLNKSHFVVLNPVLWFMVVDWCSSDNNY